MKPPIVSTSNSLYSNFGWLSVSHGINFIQPLIIYPYLLRIIGVEYFGLVMFAQAIALYFTNVVDYGYSLSGIRDVSINRNNLSKLNDIYTSVLSTKFVLVIVSFIIFFPLVLFIPKMSDNQFLIITSFTIVIGQWLLPSWFLQGLEKMKWVAMLNITVKFVFLGLILYFINQPEDYKWVNLLSGISQICLGLLCIIVLYIRLKMTLVLPTFKTVWIELKTNFLLFISNFSGFAASNSTLVIFGLIAEPVILGYYAIAERLLIILKAPAVLLYQTVYPQLCRAAESSMSDLLLLSKKVIRWVYLMFIPLGIFTCIFAKEIIYVFTGQSLDEPIELIYIISFIPFIVALNIPGTQAILAYKLDKSYVFITITGAAISIVLSIIMSILFAARGAALSVAITEICVTTMIYIIISRKYKEYNTFKVLNWS